MNRYRDRFEQTQRDLVRAPLDNPVPVLEMGDLFIHTRTELKCVLAMPWFNQPGLQANAYSLEENDALPCACSIS